MRLTGRRVEGAGGGPGSAAAVSRAPLVLALRRPGPPGARRVPSPPPRRAPLASVCFKEHGLRVLRCAAARAWDVRCHGACVHCTRGNRVERGTRVCKAHKAHALAAEARVLLLERACCPLSCLPCPRNHAQNIGGLAHAELAASGEQVPRRARASGAPAPRPRPSVITREAGAERAVRLSTLLVCCLDW